MSDENSLSKVINDHLDYIWDDEDTEDDYGVCEIKEIAEIVQHHIDSKLFTKEEISVLLRAEFISAFGGECIDHNRLIFERIMDQYYDGIRT